MNSPLRLRTLTREDIPFADSLRQLAGWNQTLADWERLLALAPDGCFLAEWDGFPTGTAITVPYGQDLAWIGMVLVHPDRRRRGIGRALLQKCIAHLQSRGVRCIKLDATPQGKAVYDGLGFKAEWTLTRWERGPDTTRDAAARAGIRTLVDADLAAISRLDAAAFGVARPELLRLLAAQSQCGLVLPTTGDDFLGYGLLRLGSRAMYLGPVGARSQGAGVAILDSLLPGACRQRVFWDIPDQNATAVTFAREHGFVVQRPLTRMYLGENQTPGNRAMQFAIAGPASG